MNSASNHLTRIVFIVLVETVFRVRQKTRCCANFWEKGTWGFEEGLPSAVCRRPIRVIFSLF
jgi:hypothetical protein